MAYHFSANQYEKQYSSKRLGNWELPKWYPARPRQRKGSTKPISDDAGHLMPTVKRVDNNPWGNFRSTYQLPDRLTRKFSDKYNECLIRRDKWGNFPQKSKHPCEDENNNATSLLGVTGTSVPVPLPCESKCQTAERLLSGDKDRNRHLHPCDATEKRLDLEYIPGDYTPPQQQHDSRRLLLQEKYDRDNELESELPLSKLYLRDNPQPYTAPDPPFTTPLPLSAGLNTPLSPPTVPLERRLAELTESADFDQDKMPQQSITGKPSERSPSPVVPAYANFELARRMHNENLDHQPLPDCVADLAYRKLQMQGGPGGFALDIDPIATGVGVKMHNAGPTHCTKMKVYRPKTCGVVPRVYNGGIASDRYVTSAQASKKLGAMDLAICWDYQPANPADEPKRPRHIDGSNDSAGPAVFNCVQTPRDEIPPATSGRSGGVFNSTSGELDFFDKDIMRRKTDFSGRNIELEERCGCDSMPAAPVRAQSVSRDYGAHAQMPSRYGKQYQSSPNITADADMKALRAKYLGADASGRNGCKRNAAPSFFRRARTRLCHKVAPVESSSCHLDMPMPSYHGHCKPPPAFRTGVPKYNAAGQFVSSDSGCSIGSNNGRCNVIAVPRPRIPYAKKNYDIETLVPPFRSFGGGAGQGGYPEHWRLASVYQHAYKPLDQRRRPLIQTVFK